MRFLILILSVLFTSGVFALNESEIQSIFEEGNSAYQEENWDLAIEKYKIIEAEYDSPALFANIGNAYYKKGELAEAIYHFSRSLKLSPNQSDVTHNLEVAKQETVDRITQDTSSGLNTWWDKNMAIVGADRLANISILIAFLALLGFGLFLFTGSLSLKRVGFYLGLVALILSFATLWFSLNAKSNTLRMNRAIIMKAKLDVKTAPTDTAGDAFVLHEGTEVIILSSEKGWYEISLGDERVGWARVSAVRGF
ncbi:MAG: tetratricopeptide (TPR) repeat protein [Flavobacteriales bacterium]|jgi:tetratricopeptide (TPR) repeat protein